MLKHFVMLCIKSIKSFSLSGNGWLSNSLVIILSLEIIKHYFILLLFIFNHILLLQFKVIIEKVNY